MSETEDEMARPFRCRRIRKLPDHWSFRCEDDDQNDMIVMSLDEYETIRLLDIEKMTQEECAASLDVARTTVTAIYENARSKLARHIVEGRPLRILGGSYMLVSDRIHEIQKKEDDTMRIAMTYEDGTVGQHFGRTEYFKVYDIEEGKIVTEQVVSTNGEGHGALAGILKQLSVDTLICGGIGMGARMALEELGIGLLPGVSGDCDEMIRAYLNNTLSCDPDETCHHHDHEQGHDCHHDEGCCH